MQISLKFVPKCPINNKLAFVELMATWHYLNQRWTNITKAYTSLDLDELKTYAKRLSVWGYFDIKILSGAGISILKIRPSYLHNGNSYM